MNAANSPGRNATALSALGSGLAPKRRVQCVGQCAAFGVVFVLQQELVLEVDCMSSQADRVLDRTADQPLPGLEACLVAMLIAAAIGRRANRTKVAQIHSGVR
jgi:hypothetical protein